MEPEPLRHYIIDDKTVPPPHQHAYEYTAGGEYIVRHCECGKSWVLVELRSLIDHKTIYEWRETREEEKYES